MCLQAMQRVMQNPEFTAAAESLGRGLMSQVADPEMMTMMELFSNPENQSVLKAKMEELKEVRGGWWGVGLVAVFVL
jgi:hypothetical protein